MDSLSFSLLNSSLLPTQETLFPSACPLSSVSFYALGLHMAGFLVLAYSKKLCLSISHLENKEGKKNPNPTSYTPRCIKWLFPRFYIVLSLFLSLSLSPSLAISLPFFPNTRITFINDVGRECSRYLQPNLSPSLLSHSSEEELTLAAHSIHPSFHLFIHSTSSLPVSLLEMLVERAPVTSTPS